MEQRLELLEEALAGLIRERERDDEARADGRSVAYHGAPEADDATPLRWRGLAAVEVERRWRDLFAWTEWLMEAFDVYTGRSEQGMWWRSRGVVEELSALRDWHHELVDVVIAARAGDGGGGEEASWRGAQARELVYWHEARLRLCERLLGPATQPLLVRAAQTSGVSDELDGTARQQRTEEFERFLRATSAADRG